MRWGSWDAWEAYVGARGWPRAAPIHDHAKLLCIRSSLDTNRDVLTLRMESNGTMSMCKSVPDVVWVYYANGNAPGWFCDCHNLAVMEVAINYGYTGSLGSLVGPM